MSNTLLELTYKKLLPKPLVNESNLSSNKLTLHSNVKRCGSSSSSYRQRLERIKTNCQLIRERRRRALFPSAPIQLRSSLFQQRSYQYGSLELLNVKDQHWTSSNFLRLSDEYLYKCKYAMFASTHRSFDQNEFIYFLRNLFSCSSIDAQDGLYRCQLCEKRFHSTEMFDLHLQRRSVSIEYRCQTCHSWIQTHNPCQAYAHLFIHRDSSSNEKCIRQLTINFDWQQRLVSEHY